MDAFKLFLQINLDKIIASIIVFLFELIVMLTISVTINNFLKNRATNSKNAYEFSKKLKSLIRTTLFIMEVIVILTIWKFELVSLLIFFALCLFAIILGGKNIIKDIFSGISIIYGDYYDIGDVIEVDGFKGKVIDIGLKTTKIKSHLNEIKIINNGCINDVINYSKLAGVGIVNVTVSYDEDIDRVIGLLDEKLMNIKDQYEQIVEGPFVSGVDDLNENGVVIRISVKTRPETQYAVERGIKKYIKELFDKENIKLAHK